MVSFGILASLLSVYHWHVSFFLCNFQQSIGKQRRPSYFNGARFCTCLCELCPQKISYETPQAPTACEFPASRPLIHKCPDVDRAVYPLRNLIRQNGKGSVQCSEREAIMLLQYERRPRESPPSRLGPSHCRPFDHSRVCKSSWHAYLRSKALSGSQGWVHAHSSTGLALSKKECKWNLSPFLTCRCWKPANLNEFEQLHATKLSNPINKQTNMARPLLVIKRFWLGHLFGNTFNLPCSWTTGALNMSTFFLR
jgi:hypothetical protein